MENLQESDPPTSWYYVQINAVPHFSYISTKSDICHEVLARKKQSCWVLGLGKEAVGNSHNLYHGTHPCHLPKKIRPRERIINHHCPLIWPCLLWSYFQGVPLYKCKWKILTLSTLLGGHGSWPSSALGKIGDKDLHFLLESPKPLVFTWKLLVFQGINTWKWIERKPPHNIYIYISLKEKTS